MEKMRNGHSILNGKPEGKRPLGRPRRRWVDMRMDIRETGWEGVDWMNLAQDREQWRALVNTILNFAFHKSQGTYRLTGSLLGFQERFFSMELVS
jgi:hypothetical protein